MSSVNGERKKEEAKSPVVSDFEALKISASKGEREAQYKVGTYYAKGRGIPKDEKIALEWYRKAAAQGHAEAQDRLEELAERSTYETQLEAEKKRTAEARSAMERMVDLNISPSDLIYDRSPKNESKLGGGSYGMVHRGTWRNRAVAIKTLHIDKEDSVEAASLMQECTALMNLAMAAGKNKENEEGAERTIKFLGLSPMAIVGQQIQTTKLIN